MLAQEGIVRKTQFPRLVIPLSSVMVAFFTLSLNLIAVFAFILIYGVEPKWTWLLLPVILLLRLRPHLCGLAAALGAQRALP